MQHYCTSCGSPRSVGATTCLSCGRQFDQPRPEAEQSGPGQPEGWPRDWLTTATLAAPSAAEMTRADDSIPVYAETPPATWDDGPLPWGYYEQPERLPPDEGGDAFWSTFSGSLGSSPGPAPSPPPGPAQVVPRQPGAHRLVTAQPGSRPPQRPRSRWRGSGHPPGTVIAAALLLVIAFGGGAYAAVTAFTGHPGKADRGPAAAGLPASPAAQASSLPPTAPATTPALAAPAATSPAATPAAGQATPPTATTPPAIMPAGQAPATGQTSPGEEAPPAEQNPPGPPAGATPITVSATARSSPAEPRVLAFAEAYFTAINHHDYQAYVSLLDSADAASYTRADFARGYSSTTDSAVRLTQISAVGDGGEAATVSFTSHQRPAQSIDHSRCDDWTITLFLVPSGSSYVKVAPPDGYASSHQAC